MMELGWRGATSVLLAGVAAVVLAGCGNSGSASANISSPPSQTVPTVQGTVMAPNGQFAAARSHWWSFATSLQFVSRAEAALADELTPIHSSEVVSLSRVLNEDAVHGSTENSVPLVPDARTDSEGFFQITHPALANLEEDCRLMVQVGAADPLNPSNSLLTRAFVLYHGPAANDIDAVSEAVVRVVLDALQNSCTQLCDFSVKTLRDLSDAAFNAAYTATGSSVAELNDNVYQLVKNNPQVKSMIATVVSQSNCQG